MKNKEDYEIFINKVDLLEFYNKGRLEPIKDIKTKYHIKIRSLDLLEIAEPLFIIKKLNCLIKVKYRNVIYYDVYIFYTNKE